MNALPFGEIVNFLDLAINLQIKDLYQKIIHFLKEKIDTAKSAVFLRISLYPPNEENEFLYRLSERTFGHMRNIPFS